MLGIVIPTKDRSEFIIKQLVYYAETNCPYSVYIGDSSGPAHLDQTLEAIEKLKGKLNVFHYHYPEADAPTAMKLLVESVKEKYSVYTGDDDYLVPNSLKKCVSFLEEHSEYSTVHGNSVMYTLSGNGAYGDITAFGPYTLKDSENDAAGQRLINYLKDYWVVEFSVRRTEDHLLACEQRDIIKDSGFAEILTNALTIVLGKSKKLNCIYLTRQIHDQRYQSAGGIDNWISTPKWLSAYRIFHQSLTELLRKNQQFSLKEAEKLTDEAFSEYLKGGFSNLRRKQKKETLDNVKQIAKQIPGVSTVHRMIRNSHSKPHGEFELSRLLQSSSNYHQDFIQAYNVITATQSEIDSILER